MYRATVGRLLIDEALPPDIRHRAHTLDKRGVLELLQHVADTRPGEYRDIARKLMGVGAEAGYASGGYSFGLKHILPARAALVSRAKTQAQVDRILDDESIDLDAKEKAIIDVVNKESPSVEKAIYDESLAENNPLALQALSGAKSGPMTLKSLRGGDYLYSDPSLRPVPLPVLRGYSEGLTPAQYLAGSYGARQGVVALKLATAEAGFFSKLLTQVSHRLIVTSRGDEIPHEHDKPRGLPVPVDDPDNEGAFLARQTGPYPRDTQLTPKVLADLKSRNLDHILVRSPMVGGPPDGGVYGLDVGVRDRAAVSPVGDYVGIAAAQAIGEPVSQSTISQKHTGGVVGTTKSVSGFRLLEQLTQVPKTFGVGATHAQLDGSVTKVEPAPQGGFYINVGEQQHYVPHGRASLVKVGDTVEAGDVLSEGIPNPAEVVEHKGLGEGRRKWVEQFYAAMKSSGITAHRRNIELVARGLINHVRLTEEIGSHVPDDVVPYSAIEHTYEPREDHQVLKPNTARGKYLERPVLHYTIGTRITPGVVKELDKFGIKGIAVHHQPPPFTPVFVRAQQSLESDPDWMTKMLGSNLEKNLLASAHRAGVSDPEGTSYVPALAIGKGFGTYGKTKGWDPSTLPPPTTIPS